MEYFLIFLAMASIALVIRLIAGGMDRGRVDRYIQQRGGKLISKRWSPFGKGWMGEKNDRIYEIQYRDREGQLHEATVKTSMLSGVYLTEDRVVGPAASHPHDHDQRDSLQQENERLRKRIAELEREHDRD